MDPLTKPCWGREELEMEEAFRSDLWLCTPMLEEDNDQTAANCNADESNGTFENGHEKEGFLGTNESFVEWMEKNDMEMAMYQQNIQQQDKGCLDSSDWDGSDPGTQDHTQALLQEFETFYEGYHGALTPPHSRTPSPPPSAAIQYIPVNEHAPIQPEVTPASYSIDLAQELAMLDELVRDRAEALENATHTVSPKSTLTTREQVSTVEMSIPATPLISVPMSTPASLVDVNTLLKVVVPESAPCIKVEVVTPSMSPGSLQEVPVSSVTSPSYYLSPNSVTPSSPGSPRPNTPTSSSCEEASDPEWVPIRVALKRQRVKPYSRSSRVTSSDCSLSERSEFSPAPSTSRGRRAPRVKGQGNPNDRKERKKEQNKNAATRYRQKKKAEAEEVASEERQLEDKNESLRAKAADLAREVSYLKKLMKEMFKARGML